MEGWAWSLGFVSVGAEISPSGLEPVFCLPTAEAIQAGRLAGIARRVLGVTLKWAPCGHPIWLEEVDDGRWVWPGHGLRGEFPEEFLAGGVFVGSGTGGAVPGAAASETDFFEARAAEGAAWFGGEGIGDEASEAHG